MLTFPPIPSWQAIHPLIVHFPIALLLVAPLFIVIGVAQKAERSFPFLLVALILMALGTGFTFLASSSGEAAAEQAENEPLVQAALDRHEDLAETTELTFAALTTIFASIILVPRLLQQPPTPVISTVLPLVLLVFYATGAITLANTAHQGGRMVHELGVRANVPPGALVVTSGQRK